MTQLDPQLAPFIQALPKAELHLHLEGAIPWELVRTYSAEPLPATPVWWREDFVFDDFAIGFSQAVRICYRPVLTSVERYYQSAKIIFAGLADQNARYVEISFTPAYAVSHGFPLPEVVDALKGAAPTSLTVCVYAGFARDLPEVLDERMKQAIWDTTALDGLDLYGDERKGEPAPFADFFTLSRARGLNLKAHAGELLGPRSIEQALGHLGVKRIEHGVAAAQDEALMQRLVAEGITLDVCPTSNLKLKVVERLADHPIRRLHQRGVCVTANTDDPTIFGCSLCDELGVLVGKLGFSEADVARLEINAFEAAKLPAAAREAIISEIASLSNRTH